MTVITDPDKIHELLEAHRFKLVDGGAAYDAAKTKVLETIRRISKRWYKLLRSINYKELFVFRFISDGKVSLDLDVYGTKLEGILQTQAVMNMLLAAKSTRWEIMDGKLLMHDKGKTDTCTVTITDDGKVRISDGKDTLESA